MIYGLFIDDSLCLDIFITLHGLSKMSLISLIAFNTSRNHICVYRAICCNYIFYVLYFIYITKVRSNYIDFHLAYNNYLLSISKYRSLSVDLYLYLGYLISNEMQIRSFLWFRLVFWNLRFGHDCWIHFLASCASKLPCLEFYDNCKLVMKRILPLLDWTHDFKTHIMGLQNVCKKMPKSEQRSIF